MRFVACFLCFLQTNRIKPTPSGKEEIMLKESNIFLADGFHTMVVL